MTPLERALRERIRSEGPISVEAYMEACNDYYYATRDPLGAAGDFTTSPEISQMFGELIGAALSDSWVRAGRVSDAVYVELGPGRGTLAADALRVLRGAGFEGPTAFVEASPVLHELQHRQHPTAEWHESLATIEPGRPLMIVANEFFDALPVRQFVGDRERKVGIVGGKFAFDRDGAIREDSPVRSEMAADVAKQLDGRGGVAIIVDYGHAEPQAAGDTLQAVRGHRFAYALDRPGEQDLTAHVDFSALAAAARESGARVGGPVSQGSWLETLGIGARAIALAARNPEQTEAIAAARRRLCDEEAMGRLFKVMGFAGGGWPMVAGLQ